MSGRDDSHPYLKELLFPVHWTDCTDEGAKVAIGKAVSLLEGANYDHMNDSERQTYDPELAKLRDIAGASSPDILAVGRLSLSRLVGASPPRFRKEEPTYNYTHDLTALSENLSLRVTLQKLIGSKLGEMMFGDKRERTFKSKAVLTSLRSLPAYASLVPEVGPLMGKATMTGANIEAFLLPHMNCKTTLELAGLGALELTKRALAMRDRYPNDPLFLVANIDADAQRRQASYSEMQHTASLLLVLLRGMYISVRRPLHIAGVEGLQRES